MSHIQSFLIIDRANWFSVKIYMSLKDLPGWGISGVPCRWTVWLIIDVGIIWIYKKVHTNLGLQLLFMPEIDNSAKRGYMAKCNWWLATALTIYFILVILEFSIWVCFVTCVNTLTTSMTLYFCICVNLFSLNGDCCRSNNGGWLGSPVLLLKEK